MDAVVEIKNLHKKYGKTPALIDINLEIGPGIFGLLGPNGAGKTTLLKILVNLLKPDRGEVKILGIDLSSGSLEIRKNIGYLGGDQRFYEYMSGEEYLNFIGLIKGLTKNEVNLEANGLFKKVGLLKSKKKKIAEYSSGMKKRLGLAQALMENPKIILLDEPTSNLDPIGRQDFLDILKEIDKTDITVIISSNILDDVEQVCDSLCFLNQGQIAYQNRLIDLKKAFPKKRLQEVFLEIISGEQNE